MNSQNILLQAENVTFYFTNKFFVIFDEKKKQIICRSKKLSFVYNLWCKKVSRKFWIKYEDLYYKFLQKKNNLDEFGRPLFLSHPGLEDYYD